MEPRAGLVKVVKLEVMQLAWVAAVEGQILFCLVILAAAAVAVLVVAPMRVALVYRVKALTAGMVAGQPICPLAVVAELRQWAYRVRQVWREMVVLGSQRASVAQAPFMEVAAAAVPLVVRQALVGLMRATAQPMTLRRAAEWPTGARAAVAEDLRARAVGAALEVPAS